MKSMTLCSTFDNTSISSYAKEFPVPEILYQTEKTDTLSLSTRFMLQSLSGFAAKAVREGINNEMIWISVDNIIGVDNIGYFDDPWVPV